MLLSLKKFERYQMSHHLKELWQEAVKNIGEYWFGIPSVPRFQIAWEFPEHIARLVGMPKYMLSRVPCDNALYLKSVSRMADVEIYPA